MTAWYMMKRLSHKAGLNKNVFQYLLRHKALSDAYAKLPEEIHRKLFGHVRGSRQTETYSHIQQEEALRVALKRLHNVEDITEEQGNKYDLEIADLKTQIAALNGVIDEFLPYLQTAKSLATRAQLGVEQQ